MLSSTPDRIRTYDLQIRSLLLYPAELRVQGRGGGESMRERSDARAQIDPKIF